MHTTARNCSILQYRQEKWVKLEIFWVKKKVATFYWSSSLLKLPCLGKFGVALLLIKCDENVFQSQGLQCIPCLLFHTPLHPCLFFFFPLYSIPRLIIGLSCTSLQGIKTEIRKCQILLQLTRNSSSRISTSTVTPGRWAPPPCPQYRGACGSQPWGRLGKF